MDTILTSREYELMRRAARFSGDEQQFMSAVCQFWSDFDRVVILQGLKREGRLDEIIIDRTIAFLDTEQHLLYDDDCNFRLRQEKDGKREATLKFRHPDQFVAQDRGMDAASADKPTTKLGHDIKTPFFPLYSHSMTFEPPISTKLECLKDLSGLFPGVNEGLDSRSGTIQ